MAADDNRALIAAYNGPMAAMSLFVAAFVLYGSYPAGGYLVDGQGYIFGRDFLNFWHYGIAAWGDDAIRFYDPWFYNGVLDRLIPGYDYPDQSWSYPPHYMLLAAPFGLVGYNWALAIYSGLGLLAYWKVIVSGFGGTGQRVALIAMPTVTVFLLCGQVSAFLAVLLVAIYRTLDRRPMVAGLLIALLTVKPQLGLLIPFFLMMTGRWKVFLWAAAGTVGFIGLSLALHGVELWRYYLTDGIALQSTTMVDSNVVVTGLMPTVFVDMIQLGADRQAAMAAQAAAALVAVFFMWQTIRATRDRFLQFAALLAASFVVTPYLMSYDTLVLGWVMAMLAERDRMSGYQAWVYRLAMIICPLGVILALFSLPGSPLVLAGVAAWVWQAAGDEQAGRRRQDVVVNRATAP